MAETLKCKICGFECGNLVPHIDSEHPEVGSKTYSEEHGGIDSVIHPSLQDKFLKGKPVESKGTVEINGAKLHQCNCDKELKHYIPKKNKAYRFQDFTSDVILDIQSNPPKPILLIGHTGTGKTSCFVQLAARIGQPTVRANMNHQTTISDFVGCWVVKAGEMEWVDGVLPYAMRHGLWLIIDELDFADAAILAALNSVLEPNGELTLKEKGHEIIVPHKNFRLFSTANAVGCMAEHRGLYQGTNIMNEAFLDRWKVYKVDYLPEDVEANVITDSIEKMPLRVSKELVKVASMIRKAFAEETVASTFSTRRLIDWGEMIVRHRSLKAQAPFKAAESVIYSKVSKEDKQAIEGIMKRVLLGRNDHA